jgi:hypothetical protein
VRYIVVRRGRTNSISFRNEAPLSKQACARLLGGPTLFEISKESGGGLQNFSQKKLDAGPIGLGMPSGMASAEIVQARSGIGGRKHSNNVLGSCPGRGEGIFLPAGRFLENAAKNNLLA